MSHTARFRRYRVPIQERAALQLLQSPCETPVRPGKPVENQDQVEERKGALPDWKKWRHADLPIPMKRRPKTDYPDERR